MRKPGWLPEPNNKYWTKLEKYDARAKDPYNITEFTPDEAQWLYGNLKASSIDRIPITKLRDLMNQGVPGFHPDRRKVDGRPLQDNLYIIEIITGLGEMWYLTKYTDDWYYCTTELFFCFVDEDDFIYRCDGFLGFKKLLERLDLVYKS